MAYECVFGSQEGLSEAKPPLPVRASWAPLNRGPLPPASSPLTDAKATGKARARLWETLVSAAAVNPVTKVARCLRARRRRSASPATENRDLGAPLPCPCWMRCGRTETSASTCLRSELPGFLRDRQPSEGAAARLQDPRGSRGWGPVAPLPRAWGPARPAPRPERVDLAVCVPRGPSPWPGPGARQKAG